jgi:hypothetical protein
MAFHALIEPGRRERGGGGAPGERDGGDAVLVRVCGEVDAPGVEQICALFLGEGGEGDACGGRRRRGRCGGRRGETGMGTRTEGVGRTKGSLGIEPGVPSSAGRDFGERGSAGVERLSSWLAAGRDRVRGEGAGHGADPIMQHVWSIRRPQQERGVGDAGERPPRSKREW